MNPSTDNDTIGPRGASTGWRGLVGRVAPPGTLRGSLASGAFWSLAGAVASRGFALVASIIIAQILGQEGFGRWGLVVVTTSAFAQFASLGIAATATKHVAELRATDPVRGGRTLALLFLVGLASVSVAALICALTAERVATQMYGAPELAFPLTVAGLMLFGMVGTLMLQGVLAGFEAFALIAGISLVQGVAFLGAAVPLTEYFGLLGTVVGMSVSQWLAMGLCLISVVRRCRQHRMPLDFGSAWQERRILWHYATPSLLIAGVTAPTHVLSHALVANQPAGLSGLGSYHASVRWRDIILFVPAAVRRVTLPMLARLKGGDDPRRFMRALAANIVLNGGMACAGALPVILLSRWILGLYGEGFQRDWDVMVILVSAGVFQAVNDVVTQVTTCFERIWWQFAVHLVYGAVLLGGAYLLVPIWGVRGLVAALVSAILIHSALNTGAAVLAIRWGLYRPDARSAAPASSPTQERVSP